MLTRFQPAIALLMVLMVGYTLTAAPASIGLIRSSGSFRVDGASVSGNATLFDGTTVETTMYSSQVRTQNGADLLLFADSRSRLFKDHAVLETGSGRLQAPANYRFDVGKYQVVPDTDSSLQVSMFAGRVEVAALTGHARVMTAKGAVLATLSNGAGVSLDANQGQASSTYRVSGTLVQEGGKYYITDKNSGVKVEVQPASGSDLSKYVGKTITVEGSSLPGVAPSNGATVVITGVATAGGVGTGLSPVALGSIIAGVAVGTGLGIAWGVGAFDSESTPVSR